MTALLLIIVPLVGAALAALWRGERSRPWLLPSVGLVHAGLAFRMLVNPPAALAGGWFAFDPLARAVLPAVSLLFLLCSAYGVAYLRARAERPNRVFVALLLTMLGLLSAGQMAQHLGVLWIATEGVTLAALPLIHFNSTARAYEATWKFLLVGGTGIALSLLGTFALGYASLQGGGTGGLTFAALATQGGALTRQWVLVSWVLVLVGYGTKMGLAPMHTWKPDTYGEAPGIVGALLAGGVTTVAFTAILRIRAVVAAAGAGAIADRSLMVVGLFSLLIAALFLLGTRDFKRMLAYSSVEHMGILALGASLGRAGLWAALFHVWSNGLTKGSLFLSAGNIRRAAGARTMDQISGTSRYAPVSSGLFLTGMFAVTALPPFAPFFSELRVVKSCFGNGHPFAGAWFLVCLLVAFFGLTRVVFAIVDGRPRIAQGAGDPRVTETLGVIAPPLVLLALSLALGLSQPETLRTIWDGAVNQLLSQP